MSLQKITPGAGSSNYHGTLIKPGESKSLSRQVILDEDEYTFGLSEIIVRDFFPSLAHLDATNGYLSALETQDPEQISKSVRRLQDLAAIPTPGRQRVLQTPSRTPFAAGPSDTPVSSRSAADSSRERSITEGVSLDEFQARYTSEDNASFATIIDDENRQRKEKWAWAWDAQRRADNHKAIEGARRETALIEAGKAPLSITAAGESGTETRAIGAPPSESSPDVEGEGREVALVPNSSGEAGQLVKVDQSQEVEDVMAPKKDTRPAGVPGWNFKARNSLMFPPDADLSPYDAISSAPAAAPTRGDPKSIHYGGTRIVEQDESSGITEPSSPTHSRVDAAIAGRPYASGGETPKVAGHSFVSATASPSPSQLGPIGLKQLMTWGTLQGTPRIISSGDDDSTPIVDAHTPFHIAEPSRRDTISHRLSNKASKSLAQRAALLTPRPPSTPGSQSGPVRAAKRTRGNMPPPIMTPRRSEISLSPAARKLLNRTGGGSILSEREGWGEAATRQPKDLGRERWTPSPAAPRQR
ncbi:hypothetical protein FRC10_009514 [Ceratobasidium sp. 414]|nr:hypothetical protein FRC10_009514 [Ceratobasidium sp. 414]